MRKKLRVYLGRISRDIIRKTGQPVKRIIVDGKKHKCCFGACGFNLRKLYDTKK